MPWLVDEIEWRSGGRIRLNPESLSGPDDRGARVVMREFKGKVKSASGQVNWAYLKLADSASSAKRAGPEVVLINHAEATRVTVNLPAGLKAVSMRIYDRKEQMDRNERPAKADRVADKPGKRPASKVATRPPDKMINRRERRVGSDHGG